MPSKDKLFTIITFVALFFTVIDFLFNKKTANYSLQEQFKNIPTTIVITDSTGKKDTLTNDYFIKGNSLKK